MTMVGYLGRIGLILSLACTFLVQLSISPALAANVIFSGSFVGGATANSTTVAAWESFRSQLTGSYNSFTWSSTNGNSITVTDATNVQNLANALRLGTTTSATIGANTWYIGTNCGTTAGYSVAVEFSNAGSCTAASTYALRPLIGNANWGGTNEYTVGAPSQTITLTFYENAPSPTTFTTTQPSPTNISTAGIITYSLIMSQSVTGLSASDFQLGGTSTCNSPAGLSGSGTTYSVTLTNCTEGTVILQLKANSVTGSTTTGPSAISSANTIIIDRTAPTISSVSAPANSTYIPGQTLSFTATMSETITVVNSPRLALTIGSTTRYATYASGSNSRSLIFNYVVQTALSDIDTNGITLSSSLELNSGSISDLATNALSALSFTAPNLTSVFVAQKPGAPMIDSISATSAQLAVNFTAGVNNGSAITNYEYSINNGSTWVTRSPAAITSPLTITGLTNGTSYPVRLRAINAAGAGDSSTALSATPTAVVVAGGSNISITYGQSASSSQFTASGGSSPYTFTLSSTPAGVSIIGGVVTASSSTPAGTYSPNVVATDSGSQSGTKQILISVAKAATTISIALPGAATSAALGGAVIITATVSRAGVVNFKVGGSSISGCSAASAPSTTATCSWTPGSLGSASITADFTPTDSSNFETSTTTTLSIMVVNGVSTVTLALAGGVTQPQKGLAINIVASIDQAGKISFFIDGKRIPGCYNLSSLSGTKTCSWKPTVQKQVNITARLTPTNNVYNASTSALKVQVIKRTGKR